MKRTVIFQLVMSVFILTQSCSDNASSEASGGEPAAKIAAAHGIAEFDKIKSLDFTFNVEKDSAHMHRRWKWFPQENRVISYDQNDSVDFKRMDTSSALLKKLNAQFTNDEYWLIFPLHLKWDKGYTWSGGDTTTGITTTSALRKYTVQYNNKDGFTPGDMYDLFVDNENVIREWAFHKGGSKEPSLVTSWDDYQDFNGLKIAKNHLSKDGKFRMHFTDITVTH
ncbi:MAG: hypothetical protein V4725_09335 [Bacteroidota bacterium]